MGGMSLPNCLGRNMGSGGHLAKYWGATNEGMSLSIHMIGCAPEMKTLLKVSVKIIGGGGNAPPPCPPSASHLMWG